MKELQNSSQLDFNDIFERMRKVVEENEKREVLRIKNLEPQPLDKNHVPRLQAPSQIYHVPKLFSLKVQHQENVIKNDRGEILMAVAPAPPEFGGKPIIEDLLIVHGLIGLYLEEQKKSPSGLKVEKITFNAKWFLKKTGFSNPGGKDVQWLKHGLLRLNMTSYFGRYFSDRGWQGSFRFIEFLDLKERVVSMQPSTHVIEEDIHNWQEVLHEIQSHSQSILKLNMDVKIRLSLNELHSAGDLTDAHKQAILKTLNLLKNNLHLSAQLKPPPQSESEEIYNKLEVLLVAEKLSYDQETEIKWLNIQILNDKFSSFFKKSRKPEKETLVLEQIILVLGRQIIEEIQRNPNFYHLGEGFKQQNGSFRKLLWFLLCGHVWRTAWLIGENKLKDLMETDSLSNQRFREKIKRSLEKMPWIFELREGHDGKILYYFTPR